MSKPALTFGGFQPEFISFLKQLSRHNHRAWFEKNKARYERDVLQPSLEFIRAFQPRLKRLSPYFLADDRRIGGSLMRIYRDTRFSRDKTPYKTNVGIHFRHQMGKDVHCAGFYLHIAPGECFLGAGIWHPDSATLAAIRQAIDGAPSRWKRARDHRKFRASFDLAGDVLKTVPRGYERDHPLSEDLRRKDFIGLCPLSEQEVLSPTFADDVSTKFADSRPFVRFLCDAVRVPF